MCNKKSCENNCCCDCNSNCCCDTNDDCGCQKNCCEAKKKCTKKCKFCAVVMMVCISFLVSLGVVKVFAPCVVKKAMMKEYIEKQMDFELFQSKMIKKIILNKIEAKISKKQQKMKEKAQSEVKKEFKSVKKD